jgi:hypothetical protein
LETETPVSATGVGALVAAAAALPKVTDVAVPVVDLRSYDALLTREAAYV